MTESHRVLIDNFGKGWERGELVLNASIYTVGEEYLQSPISQPDR